MKIFLISVYILFGLPSFAQNIGIGTTVPSPSAKVEINSTTSGLLIPRMTTGQRDAIVSPATGLLIFNTDNNFLEMWNSISWLSFGSIGILNNGLPVGPSCIGTWSQKLNFAGTSRNLASGFSIGTKGYFGTGYDGTYKKDFWEYDPANNTWSQKADFGGTARSGAVGFAINDKGYIGTGIDGSNKKDFWEYNQVLNTWTQKADFAGVARNSATGFVVGSKGYIGSGYDGSVDKIDFWEYNPISNTWTQKADFTGTSRSGAVGFSISSKGYFGTGQSSTTGSLKKDFWEFDPLGNAWTAKADLPGTVPSAAPRTGAIGFAIGSKGYVGGGANGGATKKDFWEYDPIGNSWIQKADFGGTGRSSLSSFVIGNKAYVGTGNDGTYTKDLWEYCQ